MHERDLDLIAREKIDDFDDAGLDHGSIEVRVGVAADAYHRRE